MMRPVAEIVREKFADALAAAAASRWREEHDPIDSWVIPIANTNRFEWSHATARGAVQVRSLTIRDCYGVPISAVAWRAQDPRRWRLLDTLDPPPLLGVGHVNAAVAAHTAIYIVETPEQFVSLAGRAVCLLGADDAGALEILRGALSTAAEPWRGGTQLVPVGAVVAEKLQRLEWTRRALCPDTAIGPVIDLDLGAVQ